jgi:antitoxin (DNA-binding transcriptional repressor) of toxin-antitoxin stability system
VSLCHPYTGPSSALSPPEGPETAYLPIVSPRPTACATVRLSLRPSVAAAGPSFLSFSLREAKAVAITCLAPLSLTLGFLLCTLMMSFQCISEGERRMKFISIRDLRNNTAGLRRDLQADREIVVTANGRPIAVMTRVGPDNVEEEILAIRRARARAALSRIRVRAKAEGLDRLSMDQIDAIVAQARRERRPDR